VSVPQTFLNRAAPTIEWSGPEDSDTIVLVYGGAYSDATIMFQRLLPLLWQVGRVAVVRYNSQHFDAHTVMRHAYDEVLASSGGVQPKHLLVIGLSLGGQEALRLVEYDEAQGYQFASIEQILMDVPLGWQHLPFPQSVAARALARMPIDRRLALNRKSKAFTQALFKAPTDVPSEYANDIDPEQLRRHMQAMHGLSLCAFIEQTVAVGTAHEYNIRRMPPTVVLRCAGPDKVIRGDKAYDALRSLLGDALLGMFFVPGHHAGLIEYHTGWYCKLADALELLGYQVCL
jgi:hypothetical protein